MRTDDKINQEGINSPLDDTMNEQSFADNIVDYSELFADMVFLGDMPFDVIIEGLNDQFSDYINLEDKTDYVDTFYTQFAMSMSAVLMDQSEEHPQELLEALDKISDKFLDTIINLFRLRLAITVVDEGESVEAERLEFRIRKLYNVFILNGKDNLKRAVMADMAKRMNVSSWTDDQFFSAMDILIRSYYSPLITGFTPTQFIDYIGDDELQMLFDDGEITGNFLRKYSPKFYRNDEFRCELINDFILIQQFGKEISPNGRQ